MDRNTRRSERENTTDTPFSYTAKQSNHLHLKIRRHRRIRRSPIRLRVLKHVSPHRTRHPRLRHVILKSSTTRSRKHTTRTHLTRPIRRITSRQRITTQRSQRTSSVNLLITNHNRSLLKNRTSTIVNSISTTITNTRNSLLNPIKVTIRTKLTSRRLRPPPRPTTSQVRHLTSQLRPLNTIQQIKQRTHKTTMFTISLPRRPHPFTNNHTHFHHNGKHQRSITPNLNVHTRPIRHILRHTHIAQHTPIIRPTSLINLSHQVSRRSTPITHHRQQQFTLLPTIRTSRSHLTILSPIRPHHIQFSRPQFRMISNHSHTTRPVRRHRFYPHTILRHLSLNNSRKITIRRITRLRRINLVNRSLLRPRQPLLIPKTQRTRHLIPNKRLRNTNTNILKRHRHRRLSRSTVSIILKLLLNRTRKIRLRTMPRTTMFLIHSPVTITTSLIPRLNGNTRLTRLNRRTSTHIRRGTSTPSRHQRILKLSLTLRIIRRHSSNHRHVNRFLLQHHPHLLRIVKARIRQIPLKRIPHHVNHSIHSRPRTKLKQASVNTTQRMFLSSIILRHTLGNYSVHPLLLNSHRVRQRRPQHHHISHRQNIRLLRQSHIRRHSRITRITSESTSLTRLTTHRRVVTIVTNLHKRIRNSQRTNLTLKRINTMRFIQLHNNKVTNMNTRRPKLITNKLNNNLNRKTHLHGVIAIQTDWEAKYFAIGSLHYNTNRGVEPAKSSGGQRVITS